MLLRNYHREVENFIKKLHTGEYKIDPEANKIPFGNGKTLAQALNKALDDYRSMDAMTLVPPDFTSAYAYSRITSCFAHGVVKTKPDLIKQVKEVERLLDDAASKNAQLEKDNKELRKKLTDLNEKYKKLKDKF
jgi:phage shock protein A